MLDRRSVLFISSFALCSLPKLVWAEPAPAQVATGPTIATGPTRPAPAQVATEEPWTMLFFKVDGGVAIVPHEVVGVYGRFGGEGWFTKDPESSGPIWGFWDGLEGWGAKNAGGVAIPVIFFGGYRAKPMLATLGLGFNVFTVDNLDDDVGFGIFSPRAHARIGFLAGPVMIAANAEAQYRWLWGRDEIPMIQAGLTIGYGEPQPPERH